MLMTMLANIAVLRLEMVNPLTRELTIKSTAPLMTSKKNPNVKKVIGKVNVINSGLIKLLANPSINAETTRDPRDWNLIPSNMKEVAQSEMDVANHCAKNVIMLSFLIILRI